jgi:hypothetical protein
VLGVRMNIDDSRLIVRFQRLITETLVEKELGHRRAELTDGLYETWLEVERRGLKELPSTETDQPPLSGPEGMLVQGRRLRQRGRRSRSA